MNRTREFHILLVEDNPADVMLMEEALTETKAKCHLRTVNNGDKAMSFLRRQDDFALEQPVDLVLLDLNLPGRHGHEVLAEIKHDEVLRHIPVLIFSSSGSEQDIRTSYRQYASSHIIKPAELNEFISIVESLVEYWFTIAELPHIPLPQFKSDHYGTADRPYPAF